MGFYENEENGKYINKVPYPADTKYGTPEYRVAMVEYNRGEGDMIAMFRLDLEEEFGVGDNPKNSLLFSIAWSMGHSSGLSEVYNYYAELVDLIK